MQTPQEETENRELRSAALENAREILAARARTEQELVATRDALKQRTEELAASLELVRATLDSTADGVLVTDNEGTITDCNQNYLQMWGLSREQIIGRGHLQVLESIQNQIAHSKADRERVQQIYVEAMPQSFEVIDLDDGRFFERYSKLLIIEGRKVGRVWSLRDTTLRGRTERALREETRALEVVNSTCALLASRLDEQTILQVVTDAATNLTRAEFGAFFFNAKNESGESYTLYTLSGAPREAFAKFPLPRATQIFQPTFKGEAIVRSGDILKDPRYGKSAPYHGMPQGHLAVRSYLAVPVISRDGEVHGGLFFGHPKTDVFTERDEQMVSGIASQAAIAIDNARLFESSERARAQLQENNSTLELRVAERTTALLESERQFSMLVSGVVDYGIYMLNPKGVIASWNPGAERIKGYTADEVIGEHFSRFYTDEDRAQGLPDKALGIAERTGKYEAESWRVRKDGTQFWASVVIDAIRGQNGELLGFAKVTRDMTERRAIQEQLNQSQKMEAIGQLTGGVAHDFNNLLTVILGNLETLARYLPEEEGRLRHATNQATRGARRAATLTQQLLAFSRRQPLNPKPTDINRLVVGVSDLMRRTLGESVQIETVLGAGAWRVEVDSHQLESALVNLAVNARDAMPSGGKITIETANAHLDENYASKFIEITPGQYVAICVSDTGIGMSADTVSKAFNPFFTTKPIGEGTGLGLSQVYGFVKQSGGHVKIYSEVGQGTTVRIYLPRLLRDDVEIEDETLPSEPRGKLDETILVVEDDADVRVYSTESLRELGFTVLEAADAESAMRVLGHHPEVQLVFTDVGLPGINGRELIDRVRQLRPMMKVLFTTGYARNAIVHHGRLDQGVELLTKPFTRAQLATRIRTVLDAPLGQRTVLLVEDEELVRTFLADTLVYMGFHVLTAGTVAEANEILSARKRIDLAIVDMGLPDRNGIELAHEIRAAWPQIMVIVASGFGDRLSEKLKEDSRVTFMGKPFNEDQLREAFERLGLKV